MTLAACNDAPTAPVTIEFEARSADLRDCRSGSAMLRFYLSDVAMVGADGSRAAVEFDAPEGWQDGRTALLAFHVGCEETAHPHMNSWVSGRVTQGDYRSIEFDLGVPFERNKGPALQARPPLNVPSMFWTWQSGYKFLRLDIGDKWSFHLGSTGCISASAARAPQDECGQPNLARIRLPLPEARQRVLVDIDMLLDGVDVAAQAPCVGRYAERPSCAGLLSALGLDPATGTCVGNCASQTVFRLAGGVP